MTFDGIRRLSRIGTLPLLRRRDGGRADSIRSADAGNEFAYWLFGFWLILPVSALL